MVQPPAPAGPGYYLRLSVTDRCNLRCAYCRPLQPPRPTEGDPAASDDELLELVGRIAQVGPVTKLRLTGGEPLVRAGVVDLVKQLRMRLPSSELALTTNGTLLAPLAESLHRAGIAALNISLDTLDPAAFTALTRGGRLEATLAGIEAARAAGFKRLKVNCVLIRRVNGDSLADMVRWGAERGCAVRFIELMPCGPGAELFESDYLSASEAIERLAGRLSYLGPCEQDGTARLHRFAVDGDVVHVGMITPVSHPFCAGCRRLRLDCRGRLVACLRRSGYEDLLGPLRRGDDQLLTARVIRCVTGKTHPGQHWPKRQMVLIGG